jgi:hypothetical protein
MFLVILTNIAVYLYQIQKLMETKKKCTGCKSEKELTQFYKNKLIHDGHSNYCVECTKTNSKKYFQRKKDRTVKLENENLMKMMFINNYTQETHTPQADNLMKILMIEKMCKSLLDEVENLKRGFVKTQCEVVE